MKVQKEDLNLDKLYKMVMDHDEIESQADGLHARLVELRDEVKVEKRNLTVYLHQSGSNQSAQRIKELEVSISRAKNQSDSILKKRNRHNLIVSNSRSVLGNIATELLKNNCCPEFLTIRED